MAILPATGSQITFGNVKRGYSNTTGSNVSLRGTLGGYLGISSGTVSLSSTFGGHQIPYNQFNEYYVTAKALLAANPHLAGKDGYYYLYPTGLSSSQQLVYCDMTTDGGGWMLVSRSHPSVVNYNGTNWGWRGGKMGIANDFSQAYQAGWWTYWNANAKFTEFIFGNRANINNNAWGPFVYKRYELDYTTFTTSDTQQGASSIVLKSNAAVYGQTDFPGMQGAIGYPISGTANNFYYMRDCCGFAGYGAYATGMWTTYCGANFYYAGPWCGGSSTDSSGNFQDGTFVSNGLTHGGTNQYMIMVR